MIKMFDYDGSVIEGDDVIDKCVEKIKRSSDKSVRKYFDEVKRREVIKNYLSIMYEGLPIIPHRNTIIDGVYLVEFHICLEMEGLKK